MDTLTATPLDVVIVVVIGYLVGSIPVANTVARRTASLDLRDVGDNNPGFWNARSVLSSDAAAVVLVGDITKGALAAAVGVALADDGVWVIAYVATAAAMVGHAYPLFAGFRGGRSVLTFVGGMAVAAPVPAAIAAANVAITFSVTRSFARSARVGIALLPAVQFVVDGPHRTAATGALMTFIGLRFAMAGRARRHR